MKITHVKSKISSGYIWSPSNDSKFRIFLREQLPMETLYSFEGHEDEVWYVQFSHSGHYIASASKDTSVIVWNVETRQVTHTLIGHKEPVSFLSWSPDDTMILTCGSDKKLKLWDMDSGSCRRTFSRHSETVLACAWLPDNERFVSGGLDKNIFLWVNILKEDMTCCTQFIEF